METWKRGAGSKSCSVRSRGTSLHSQGHCYSVSIYCLRLHRRHCFTLRRPRASDVRHSGCTHCPSNLFSYLAFFGRVQASAGSRSVLLCTSRRLSCGRQGVELANPGTHRLPRCLGKCRAALRTESKMVNFEPFLYRLNTMPSLARSLRWRCLQMRIRQRRTRSRLANLHSILGTRGT